VALDASRRVLVTGATGTLGFNVISQLVLDEANKVFAPIRTIRPFLHRLGSAVELIVHDVQDEEATNRLIQEVKPDVIVHCAASGVRPPRSEWFEMIVFNVAGSIALFKAYCALPKSTHFIYISTGLVYRVQQRPLREDDPVGTLHPYGAGKAAADSLLLAAAAEFKRTVTVLRPFAFTGIHDGSERLFPGLLRSAAAGQPFCLTSGEQVRDFCAVEDVARAVVACVKRKPRELIEVFNIGSGRSESVRALIERVCHELTLTVDLQFGRAPLQPFEPSYLVADISRARQELGWEPKINLAYAVWQLALEIAPTLKLSEPNREFDELSVLRHV
jgi:nucleoside-diphosphate-sugar epimerase